MLAVFWIGFVAVVVIVGRRRKFAPLAPIGEAPEAALVRLAGQVVADNALRAPLSGRPCTCYFFTVTTHQPYQRVRWSHRDARDFRLLDATGTATIAGECVHLEVSADIVHNTTRRQLPDDLRAILERWNIRLDKASAIDLYEGTVADGDEIEVVGSGMRTLLSADGCERGFRDTAPTLFELRGAVHVLGARRPIRTL